MKWRITKLYFSYSYSKSLWTDGIVEEVVEEKYTYMVEIIKCKETNIKNDLDVILLYEIQYTIFQINQINNWEHI